MTTDLFGYNMERPLRGLAPGTIFLLQFETSGSIVRGIVDGQGSGSTSVSTENGHSHWCLDTLVVPTGESVEQFRKSIYKEEGEGMAKQAKQPKEKKVRVAYVLTKNDASVLKRDTNAGIFYTVLEKAGKPLQRANIYAGAEKHCETGAAHTRLGGQIGDTLAKLVKMGLIKRDGESDPKPMIAKVKAVKRPAKATSKPKTARRAKGPKAASGPAQGQEPASEASHPDAEQESELDVELDVEETAE